MSGRTPAKGARRRRAPAPPATKRSETLLRDCRERRLELAAMTDAAVKQHGEVIDHWTALSAAQREVIAARRRLAEMYDFVPVPYLMLSDLGVIVKANQRAVDLLGTDRAWVIGRPLLVYIDRKDLQTVLDDVYRCPAGHSATVEVGLRTPKAVRPAQLVVRCEESGTGGGLILHVAIVDLAEMRELEARRRVAEEQRHESEEAERAARTANEAKDEFLAVVSHELRTPLTPILAAADSLAAHDLLSPDLRTKIDVIRRNVKAEARLIDDLLDVARINSRRFEIARRPIDLHDVLHEVLDSWTASLPDRHVTLEIGLQAGACWVDGDAGRLAQVFRNLIGNALKFTDAGGTIAIRTDEHDGRIAVTVSDTGLGMTGAQVEKLFTPFARRNDGSPRRGLGLGLIISRAIVEAHQGVLAVRSAGRGNGTTVTVGLPTISPPATEEERPAVAVPAPARSAKVLLVEDDRDSAQMLAMLLASEGFEVHVAGSIFRARQMAEWCEIVVSDIALPDGTGLDLIRTIRATRPIRAIALSGYGSRQDIRKSLEAGFEEHLTKPVDLDRLIAAVRRLATAR